MKKEQKRRQQKTLGDKDTIFESVIAGGYWDFNALVAISYLSRFVLALEEGEISSEDECLLVKFGESNKGLQEPSVK